MPHPARRSYQCWGGAEAYVIPNGAWFSPGRRRTDAGGGQAELVWNGEGLLVYRARSFLDTPGRIRYLVARPCDDVGVLREQVARATGMALSEVVLGVRVGLL